MKENTAHTIVQATPSGMRYHGRLPYVIMIPILEYSPIAVHKYLIGGTKEVRDRLFSVVLTDRMRRNKLKYGICNLDLRNFFTVRVAVGVCVCSSVQVSHYVL